MAFETEVEPVDFREVTANHAEILSTFGDGLRITGLEVAEVRERNVRLFGGLAWTQQLTVTPSSERRHAVPRTVGHLVVRVGRRMPEDPQLDLPFPVVEVPCEVWGGGQVRSFQTSGIGVEAEFSGITVDEAEHDGAKLSDPVPGRADSGSVERIACMRGSVDERLPDFLEDVRKEEWWGRGTRHATTVAVASTEPRD